MAPPDFEPRNFITDNLGFYHFDSATTAPTGDHIAATFRGYFGEYGGLITVAWNSIISVPTMYLTSNLGTLSGMIRRDDSNSVAIPNAKVLLFLGNIKVDSTISDAGGNYSIKVGAATYTVKVGAAGFKSNAGLATQDTTGIVIPNGNTILDLKLTPAFSTIGGTLHRTNATTGPIVSGAKVVLQHRNSDVSGNNTWVNLDSVASDINGIFSFSNLIAAPDLAGGSYRFRVIANAFINYPAVGAETLADVYQVAYGTTLEVNIVLTICPGTTIPRPNECGDPFPNEIRSYPDEKTRNIGFSLIGHQIILNLSSSNTIRTLEIFDLKGVLQQSIQIPANESRIVLPASFAPEKGFLYGVK